ncbi:family 16 glycoside hydrolase [Wenyingzhuangia aestuarii]|uniref:family 16 glycoside hydrolase n=1 Tax=Wenyingzhuangia aestuarii TaxID=1647582 RepID=UPI0014391AF7|nr:family 16 glycoside hydrolase [Wenyingzhuangia aestuarii]NJB83441.1 hypothetical protein [Wenyingzhuangia aestuarii]
MKKKLILLALIPLVISCSTSSSKKEFTEKKQIKTLPATAISLDDLSDFKNTDSNWSIVGDVYVDRQVEKKIEGSKGKGVLMNTPTQEHKKHLFTKFEHGDIELELDVMMPLKSNSGLYFQGRYEIQLYDSWKVTEPAYKDMGGIYQRWDKTKPKGQEGFQGHAPKTNAAKAPGLWQHLKIIFHAPRFDNQGTKIKNAWFEEVRLNNILIHENVEVTGPTRAAPFNNEKPLASLMIQGDHGPVAFKNITYKLYKNQNLKIHKSDLKIYDNSKKESVIKDIAKFRLLEEHQTDSISPLTRINRRDQKIVSYTGTLDIPTTGDYLFEATVNGGAYLIINKDTIVNLNNNSWPDKTVYHKVYLEKGTAPYQFVYNKPIVWRNGLDFFIEGPNIQRYSLLKTSTSSLSKQQPIKPITLNVTNTPITQRSFITHKGIKKSHCISVGLVENLNYSLDLETASLLLVWSDGFLDTTQMWHSRGTEQLAMPIGPTISSHGNIDFALLANSTEEWPTQLNNKNSIKQLGYEFNNKGIPSFNSEINGTKITNSFIALPNSTRGLQRTITTNSKNPIWHKVAEGEKIKLLDNNTYIINNESYYIQFPNHSKFKPIVRNSNGKDELIIEISKGNNNLNYNIIW